MTFNITKGRFAGDWQVGEPIGEMLGKVGLGVTSNTMEYTVWLRSYKTAGEGFQIPGNLSSTQAALSTFDSRAKAGSWWGYDNPEVNSLLDKAGSTLKREDRLKVYGQISRIIRDEAPWIFLFNQQLVHAVRDRVKDWTPRGDELLMVGQASVA